MPSFSNSPSTRPSEGPSSQPTISNLVNLGGNPNFYTVTDFVPRTWSDCESLGLRENLVLASFHPGDTMPNLGTDNFWTGAFRGSSGAFEWTDGTPWDYSKWASNEPDNPDGLQNHVLVYGSDNFWRTFYFMNRASCLWLKI